MFSNFSTSDIARAVIVLMIILSYFWLTSDGFLNITEDMTTRRRLLWMKIVSFFASLITVGFLLSVFFETSADI